MRTPVLLSALLLMIVASPLVNAGGGHDEGTPEPVVAAAHEEEGASSPELLPGTSWSYNVTAVGTFDYHCHPHPWMLAALNVLPSDGSEPRTHVINITEPAGEPFENWTFSPKIYEVRVGDNVTWVNQGSVMHRVTQTVGEHIAHVGILGGSQGTDEHVDEAAHVEAGAPSGLWWLLVAALGAGCVALWVRGNKKAP